MFRDTSQETRAIRAMLAPAGLDRHWRDKFGLDESAREYVRRAPYTADGVLLRVALALVGAGAEPWIGEVLSLPEPHRERVLSLALAWSRGPDAVDAWLVEHEGAGGRQ